MYVFISRCFDGLIFDFPRIVLALDILPAGFVGKHKLLRIEEMSFQLSTMETIDHGS